MPQNPFPHILVGLDVSSMDACIMSFLDQNHKALNADKIHFIHVREDLPRKNSEQKTKEGSSGAPGGDLARELSDMIGGALPEAAVDRDIHLVQGDPEHEIRDWSTARGIDLIVLGHKRSSDHEVKPKKLVKKPACSLLLIPQKDDYKIRRVGVGVDFSELSRDALNNADMLARNAEAALVGFHAYQVPSGYHKSGKDHQEFAKVMEDNARKEAEAFLGEVGIDNVQMEYAYDESNKPARCIAQFARDKEIDLLVVGSKGRTEAASLLMGSIAKELVKELYDMPLLIVKDKNDRMDLVEALKKV